jgi:1,4-dihydroxy-2-naphthoate octaprenyltransferase
LFVFVFFGLVAVTGSAYVSLDRVTGLALLASVPVGLLSVSVLVVNNLRDIPTDRAVGKQTLAVRMGDAGTRRLYVACLTGAFVVALMVASSRHLALVALLAAALAVGPAKIVLDGAEGGKLIPVLAMTGRLVLAFGVLLTVGIAW